MLVLLAVGLMSCWWMAFAGAAIFVEKRDDRKGYEMVADELRVEDDGFEWELHGTCAYASDFDYASA